MKALNKLKVLGARMIGGYNATPTTAKIKNARTRSKHKVKLHKDLPDNWVDFASTLTIESGGTVVKFIPFEYQKDAIAAIEKAKYSVLLKSRQMGCSEMIISYILFRAVREPGFKAMVISKTQTDSSELGKRIQQMAASLGEMCPKIVRASEKKIIFKNLGEIYLMPCTSKAGRGLPSVSLIFIDECAFIDNLDDLFQAAVPATSMVPNAKIILNSTPNGKQGLYFRTLQAGVGEQKRVADKVEAIKSSRGQDLDIVKRVRGVANEYNGKHHSCWIAGSWAKILLHWRAHPRYGKDPKWGDTRREELNFTKSRWDQEFELSFVDGTINLFNYDDVMGGVRGTWLKNPQRGRRYAITIDPAFGGADSFTAQVWDVTDLPDMDLVAEYSEPKRSKDYSLEQVGQFIEVFEPIGLAIEINSGGKIIAEDLSADYPYLQIYEVAMTQLAKIRLTDKMILKTERGELGYPEDAKIISEMLNFLQIDKRREAASGLHDDCVMACSVIMSCIEDLSDAWDDY
jgi:hypothetical protein